MKIDHRRTPGTDETTKLFGFIERYMKLTDEEKAAIVEFDIFRSYPKGTVLLEAGQWSNRSYFVLDGCIRTYFLRDGDEKTTEFYLETEVLTPSCVTEQGSSEYFVGCVEDSILMVSTPDMDRVMFEKFPRFESLCRILSEELLAKSRGLLDDFKMLSVEERYLSVLRTRPELIRRVPQYQLASYLGITPQSLSRMRSRLAGKKVVHRHFSATRFSVSAHNDNAVL
jgi:CRP-like cAMP-binding protein